MTRFLDGPAMGTTLFLRRAPHYLRVVQGPDGPTAPGTVDALDQLDDTPSASERITAYEMVGEPGYMHVRMRKGGGVYRGGTYRMVAEQPDDATLRDAGLWRAWVSQRIGQPVGPDGSVQEAR